MSILYNILGMLISYVYKIVSSIGTEPKSMSYLAIAIIVTTIVYNILILPITYMQKKSAKKQKFIGPLQKEIQTKYKSQPEVMQKKMKELYLEHDFNPLSSCLPMIVFFPVMFAFFGVMRDPTKYIFGGEVVEIAKNFLWIQDLSLPDPYIYGLPLINSVLQFLSMKFTMEASTGDGQADKMTRNMMYFMPVIILISANKLAAGVFLYWMVSSLMNLIIGRIIMRVIK